MRIIVAAALALTAAACAKAPESIAPAYVSDVGYQGYTCPQLGKKSQQLTSTLAAASVKQNHARSRDAVGVFLIGLPLASMSGGDIAPEIARLKGEQEAVGKASLRKGCLGAPAQRTRPAPRAAGAS
jgi:hypothetical protein